MHNKKLPTQHEVFTLPRTRSCGGLSEGTCTACKKCEASEYQSEACSDTKDAVCTGCGLLRDCPAGTYRKGCGSGSIGICDMCASCAAGFYRVECGGFSEGRYTCHAITVIIVFYTSKPECAVPDDSCHYIHAYRSAYIYIYMT
jgi:hypothetical protein